MEEEKLHAFIEIAGLETEEEFYEMFPTEEAFFEAFPEAREQFNFGGLVGAAAPGFADLMMKLFQGGGFNSDPMQNEGMKSYMGYKNNPGNIFSPDQALSENEAMMSRARMAGINPLTQTLDAVGGMGLGYGVDLMNQKGNLKKKAFGGNVNTPVEVEGDEVAQLPQGGLIDFEGPTHERGGIPVELPSGTNIFSNRIKIDGITTADRKKKRDKKEKKLEKTFADNITDILVKNALERTQQVHQQEEAFDTNLQGEVENYMNPQEEQGMDPNMMPPEMMGEGQFKWGGGIPYYNGMMDVISKIQSGEIKGPEDPIKSGEGGVQDFFKDNPFSAATIGDMMLLAGNAQQAISPMRTTLEQRAGDTPNVNPFLDYGKEGLKTLQKSKNYAEGNKDRVKQELELARVANSKRNRNSSRGVNTMRAMDIAGDMQMDSAERGIENDFATQMMTIFGQEAGAKDNIDSVVMGGEQTRDESDRHDRGQFFTNLGEDRVNLGEGISQIGKNLNKVQNNTVNENLLSNLYDTLSYNIKTGRSQAKIGIEMLTSMNQPDRAFKLFEEVGAWKDAGIKTQEEWDALSEEKKKEVFKKYQNQG